MTVPRVAIIDYGMGNLFSVARACERAGMAPFLAPGAQDVRYADAIILPGVGAMPHAMEVLGATGLADAIRDAASAGRSLMGICLGMQLMMKHGTEYGAHEGLGIVDGDVVKFSGVDASGMPLRVPHIGWCAAERVGTLVDPSRNFMSAVPDSSHFYFVHSYYVRPSDPAVAVAQTRYGNVSFCSAYSYRNVFGCQFHPERSGPRGLAVYKAFAKAIS